MADGRTGRLQNVTRESGVACVVMGNRRMKIPAADLVVFSTHLTPAVGTMEMRCCFQPADSISADDRLTTDPGRVSCQGFPGDS